ncbi:MAG TPA: hypothetical protein VH436_02870 [Vicinamibacterales bacterium]|jgi:hypothetical protein
MATVVDRLDSTTDEDRTYTGSRFADVVAALLANPYQRVWGAKNNEPLPVHTVTFRSVSSGMLRASERAVDSGADLRWGPDRKGFTRLVHPNGVCLMGTWEITERTDYTGYFTQGSRALMIGRYSTCCTETRRGRVRSLSLAGKLFPTIDADHLQPLRTANFLTQEDIGGARTDYINDADLRNAPDITATRRGAGIATLLATGSAFQRADKEPGIRQLYAIAELGKPEGAPTRTPEFMRLRVAAAQPRIAGANLDCRDEVMAQIFDPGDPVPKRTLTFTIEVTDQGKVSGPPFRVRWAFTNWRAIGRIVFNNASVSHNGDAVLHFNHPTWRTDRNDPRTATRINGRKVSD